MNRDDDVRKWCLGDGDWISMIVIKDNSKISLLKIDPISGQIPQFNFECDDRFTDSVK